MIEVKLKLSHDQVINDLKLEDFYNNKLSSLICDYYNKSITSAVLEAYDDKFMPWEFSYHRWTKEDARKAILWPIDKLKEEGKPANQISYYDFKNNKLRIVIDKYYTSSPKKAIEDVGSRCF